MLMFGRNQYSTVKQLSLFKNKYIKNLKKKQANFSS